MPAPRGAKPVELKTVVPPARPPHSIGKGVLEFLFAAPFAALSSSLAGFALFASVGALFLFLSYRPLWHTDLWGHLAYGRWIVEHRALPSTEPLMPLCRAVPFVDFSWLSEVIGYATYQWNGPEALQLLYAGGVTTCVGFLAWGVWRKTRSNLAAALAAALYLWVDWRQLAIARPQLAGCVCFMLLFVLARAIRRVALPIPRLRVGKNGGYEITASLVESKFPFPLMSLAVVILFAAWANLHGSFLVGLALLAATVCGRAGDVLRRTGSLRIVYDDRAVRRGVVLLVIAMAAVLLNPYGWRIYSAAWQLAVNPNLADLVEWKPLGLWMSQARAALAVSIGLLAVYALTPRRISIAEPLLLVGFGAAAVTASRMIVWWGPIAAYYAALHAAAIAKRRPGTIFARAPRFERVYAVCTRRMLPTSFPVVVIMCAVFLNPVFTHDFLGRASGFYRDRNFSAQTPVAVAEYLVENPPRGQVFNTLEWGDYLLWAGPARLEVFVASHVHLIPRSVWQDCVRVITLDDGWQKILERYRINTAIVDDDQHAALADALRADPAWSVAYEDAQGLIFVRRHPL
jgi:hypothetical protein